MDMFKRQKSSFWDRLQAYNQNVVKKGDFWVTYSVSWFFINTKYSITSLTLPMLMLFPHQNQASPVPSTIGMKKSYAVSLSSHNYFLLINIRDTNT